MTSRAGGRHEHPAGGARVRPVAEDHPEDAAIFAAAGLRAEKTDPTPEAGPWLGIIDQILMDDQSQPKKQRHTAKRIWDRLKAEHRFGGGYTVVKDYVRQTRLRHKEVFVPLAHPPGDAQADFGEALVLIAGAGQKAHFQCVDLPHSDDCFVVAFPAENSEAFLEGHNQAFTCFGGVPRTILYDNTRIAVREIAGDGERKPTEAFSGLQSHDLFVAKFGRPGKGNDKGKEEGLVGYARRNFMVPAPRAASWEELQRTVAEGMPEETRAEAVGTPGNYRRAVRAGSGTVAAPASGAVGSVRQANHES
jgi:transposase